MKPCCLNAKADVARSTCEKKMLHKVIGGTTAFHSGACPATAEDAVGLMHAPVQILPQKEKVLDGKGCCFSIGFGALMKPCCLKAKPVSGKTDCPSANRLGGRTGYHIG